MIRMLVAAIAAVGAASAAVAQGDIRIERREGFLIYAREFRGDYRQHPQAVRILRADLESRGLLGETVVGIYPDDPDAVGMPNVRWELAVALASRRRSETVAAFRARSLQAYSQLGTDRLRVIEPEVVSVLDSTTRRSVADGLRLLRWLPTSGYAQAGPTRIEYLGLEPNPDQPIRIVVPLRARTWAGRESN